MESVPPAELSTELKEWIIREAEHASYLRFHNGGDTMYQVRKDPDFKGPLLLSFRANPVVEPAPAPAIPTRKVRFHAS